MLDLRKSNELQKNMNLYVGRVEQSKLKTGLEETWAEIGYVIEFQINLNNLKPITLPVEKIQLYKLKKG